MQHHNTWIGILLIAIICSLVLAGCSSVGQNQATADTKFLSVTDAAGNTVEVAKKPERIVVLSTSILDLLYAVDGKAIGRPSSKTSPAPEGAKDLPEIGYVYNINAEKVVSLQPDLIIGVQGMHEKLVPVFESNHIPVVLIKYRTLDDTYETLRLLAKLSGTQEKAESVIQHMQEDIQHTVDSFSQEKRYKVAILHGTAKDVTVELPSTTAGSIAKSLHMINIAEGSTAINPEGDVVSFSLEKIVQEDPDDIFVVTMGDINEIKKNMNANFETNPAWNSLRAVKQHNIYYLPQELFLLNPGIKMPEAVRYMASHVQ